MALPPSARNRYDFAMTTVTLTPDLERFAADVVATGRYRDVGDVVQAAIGLLQRAEAERAAFSLHSKPPKPKASAAGLSPRMRCIAKSKSSWKIATAPAVTPSAVLTLRARTELRVRCSGLPLKTSPPPAD